LAAGIKHSCAVIDGAALCWGANLEGELGNGTTGSFSNAVAVVGLPAGATAVAAGEGFTCAVAGGDVYCWGSGVLGVLGQGTLDDHLAPVWVVGIPAGTSTAVVAGENHACALAGDDLYCWGSRRFGEAGDGGELRSVVPVRVVGY
jgi:alpha-tubulin suppressor-like RCC1 family protein